MPTMQSLCAMPAAAQLAAQQPQPWPQQRHAMFERQAHCAQAKLTADGKHQGQHGRVQVEVLVGVHVIERQTARGKGLELRTDFIGQLAPHARQKKEAGAVTRHALAETAIRIDQVGNCRARQHGLAVGQHQVQPDPQAGTAVRGGDGFGGGRGCHHQAGGIENAIMKGALDCGIDAGMQAEIVGGNDQSASKPGHSAPFFILAARQAPCARRKRKNSTPSRSRRFVMSQLRSISRTISQIFAGRK
jgi:hypothetical protein